MRQNDDRQSRAKYWTAVILTERDLEAGLSLVPLGKCHLIITCTAAVQVIFCTADRSKSAYDQETWMLAFPFRQCVLF